jgi:hypothetical protein
MFSIHSFLSLVLVECYFAAGVGAQSTPAVAVAQSPAAPVVAQSPPAAVAAIPASGKIPLKTYPPGKGLFQTDKWYQAPRNINRLAPGSIIRQRLVPRPVVLNGTRVELDAAWQILYKTRNSLGGPLAAVTTLLKPKNAKLDHHFVQGFFTVCDTWLDC